MAAAGLEGSTMLPVKRHGLELRLRLLRMVKILENQWQVARTPSQTVQLTFEKLILIWFSIRVADRQFDNCDFIFREDALAEGILAVILLECMALFDGKADHEMHRVGV
jgi:hypothetical protein